MPQAIFLWNLGISVSLPSSAPCPARQRSLAQKRKLSCVLTSLVKLASVGMLRRDMDADQLDDLDKADGMYVVQIGINLSSQTLGMVLMVYEIETW